MSAMSSRVGCWVSDADISMTLNRYSHVTPDMQRSAADVLDAAFRDVS
jgi:hypothetical protein